LFFLLHVLRLRPTIPHAIDLICPHKPKILVTLRNPVERAFSQYSMLRQKGNRLLPNCPNTTFEQAIETEVNHLIQRGLLAEGTLSLSEYKQRRNEFDVDNIRSLSPINLRDISLEEYAKVASNVLLINETASGEVTDSGYFPHLLFRGMYALQLVPWVKKFGQDERMMILRIEDFAGDDANQTEVEEKILLFAGLTNPVLKERKRQVKANGFTKSEMNPITKEYLTWLYQPFNDLLPTLLGEEWRGVWDRNITKANLPIYLLQPDTDQTVQIKWGKLAQMWNRTIQYEDIVQQSTPISSLPPLPSSNLRLVVMLHTSPKMGSSTIREACSVNYEKTCGIPYKAINIKPYHGQSINRPRRPIPLGYQDGKTLYPMIRKCRNTSHFCVKGIILPTGIPTYDDVMFVHMFPFRNYNEFAKSALKQRYDVEGNSGCSRVKSLLGECKPGRYELDLRRYSKTQLSRFKEEVVQRMNDRNEHHIFLLYHHRELDSVLDKLSGVYNIPRLPGSNGTRNKVRPKGTCEDSEKLLDMYHDCFSDELMELT